MKGERERTHTLDWLEDDWCGGGSYGVVHFKSLIKTANVNLMGGGWFLLMLGTKLWKIDQQKKKKVFLEKYQQNAFVFVNFSQMMAVSSQPPKSKKLFRKNQRKNCSK